ncbi:MAG: hypothetical protein PSV13_04025 [Lacunisphaera sp.]|nr:hypothetical protein [Lacunisphaera sp.]
MVLPLRVLAGIGGAMVAGESAGWADYVVHGIVVSATETGRDTAAIGAGDIAQQVEFEIIRVFQGSPRSPILLEVLGGRTARAKSVRDDPPGFRPGEESILVREGNILWVYPLGGLRHGYHSPAYANSYEILGAPASAAAGETGDKAASSGLNDGDQVRLSPGTEVVGAPANDNFANAGLVVTPAGDVPPTGFTSNNLNATKEFGEPDHVGNVGGHSVWWKWTAPGNCRVSAYSENSNFTTVLAAYIGTTIGSLTPVTHASYTEKKPRHFSSTHWPAPHIILRWTA